MKKRYLERKVYVLVVRQEKNIGREGNFEIKKRVKNRKKTERRWKEGERKREKEKEDRKI